MNREEIKKKLHVVKRDGRLELMHFDKITSRVNKLSWGLDPSIDATLLTQKVTSSVYSGVTTAELDELTAQTAAHMVTTHPDWALLASRITVSNLHKSTKKIFSEVVEDLYNYVNPKTGKHGPLISDWVYKIVMENKEILNSMIVYDRDYNYDYFGIMTLCRAYLLKINGKIAECPQHMLMRVAIGIHKDDFKAVKETYDLMSNKIFTHASPTMFNAGTPRPQLSSCFLLKMKEDSIEGIYGTLTQCAQISKNAGGIGVAISNIRSTGSYIRGTNGTSNGIVPMLRVFNNTARYVDQGGGKRKGSFAMYLEPWHADIFEFLELRKNHGKEEERARDLFYALWVPDLFMERVQKNKTWSLMCPNECPGLVDCWGEEFKALYEKYEKLGKFHKQIPARDLWGKIMDSQIETGTPYMLYKDHCNRKSNQQNLGTIKSSNLCTEIIEYTSEDEVAVCNLASVALPKFVDEENKTYNFQELAHVIRVMTRNLNKVIDVNFYPVKEAKNSNMRHRPVGLGVQGLADVFQMLRMPFESDEAKLLNKQIFETIYYAAVDASCELAKKEGPYPTYEGCPASKGKLQFDLWDRPGEKVELTGLWDWDELKARVKEYGLRNSLLVAPMPTASTSQILGNNECFEPYTANVYLRRTLAGEFVVVNRHLLKDLLARGLWTDVVKHKLLQADGSCQQIEEIPQDLKDLYKSVWEISQKHLIDMARDRGAFIDQSQSFNVHMVGPTRQKLTSMHFYGWNRGLKTGMYYLRSQAAVNAIKFTVDKTLLKKDADQAIAKMKAKAAAKQDEDCVMCGS